MDKHGVVDYHPCIFMKFYGTTSQRNPVLLFLHTFLPKSAYIIGLCPPLGRRPQMENPDMSIKTYTLIKRFSSGSREPSTPVKISQNIDGHQTTLHHKFRESSPPPHLDEFLDRYWNYNFVSSFQQMCQWSGKVLSQNRNTMTEWSLSLHREFPARHFHKIKKGIGLDQIRLDVSVRYEKNLSS